MFGLQRWREPGFHPLLDPPGEWHGQLAARWEADCVLRKSGPFDVFLLQLVNPAFGYSICNQGDARERCPFQELVWLKNLKALVY